MRKLVYGVGLNDADYTVRRVVNGKEICCPFYMTWRNMLLRCYNKKCKTNHPSYEGCYVSDDWLIFSNFKNWMKLQSWEGNALDKDILYKKNKVYSSSTCVFVSKKLNNFLTHMKSHGGRLPVGVTFHPKSKKFIARCHNGNGKRVHIGMFDCIDSASQAWKNTKHIFACEIAAEQLDERIAKSLRNWFCD